MPEKQWVKIHRTLPFMCQTLSLTLIISIEGLLPMSWSCRFTHYKFYCKLQHSSFTQYRYCWYYKSKNSCIRYLFWLKQIRFSLFKKKRKLQKQNINTFVIWNEWLFGKPYSTCQNKLCASPVMSSIVSPIWICNGGPSCGAGCGIPL